MLSSCPLPSELSDEDVLKCVLCTSPLENPVLLNCLHSACKSCICDRTGHVTCPECLVTTDTAAAAAGKTNLLVSSLAHRSRIIKSMFSCAHCSDEDKQDATAMEWCYTCQQPLCADFQKYHNRLYPTHKMIELTEHTVLSELYRPPLRCCTKHGDELRFACFTCCDGCCVKCAHSCYTSLHDIQPLEGPVAVKRISDKLTGASRMLSDLHAVNVLLQPHLKLSEKFTSARQESLTKLRNAKRTAMESISRAYTNAEKSLLECWDTMASRSFRSQEAVEILKRRLDWTNKYCQMAINSNDVAGLLPQLDAMSSSASTLLAEARLVKEPVDPFKMVSISICLPHDLDLIADGWFGMAKVVCDDLDCSVNESPAEDSGDNYTLSASSGKEAGNLLEKRSEYHEHGQQDKGVVQLTDKQLLVSTSNEAENQLDRRSERRRSERRRERKANDQTGALLVASSGNETGNQLEMQNQCHERLQHESRVVQLPSEQLLVSTSNEAENQLSRRRENHEYLQLHNRVVQPHSEQVLEANDQTDALLVASSGNEAGNQLEMQKQCHERLQHESRVVQLPSEQLLVSTSNEAENQIDRRRECHGCLQHENRVVQPPSEQLLVSQSNETCCLLEARNEYREHLQHECRVMQPPSEQLLVPLGDESGNLPEKRSEYHERLQHDICGAPLLSQQLLASFRNEPGKLHETRSNYREYLQHENRTVQPPSEHLPVLSSNEACGLLETRREHHENVLRENPDVQLPKEQLFASSGDEAGHVPHERHELHEQFQRENRIVSLPSEPLFAAPKPLSAFKGPGKCWDVAVTPQGRLLVAATSDGLKEYDATSFGEISTWRPDSDARGEHTTTWVSTVDALADGRAVVGLFFSKEVVLLQRSIDGVGDFWHVERLVADLQAPPRHLSAFGGQLLAVLEDRFDERTNSWRPGPGLVLISLIDRKPQHRVKLDYDACSVALTDRVVVVTSNDAMELVENDSSGGYSKKSYVVDCFSHLGARLWRRIGLKVMSICTDSVGRVIYAAQSPGRVVLLGVDDGRELSVAIRTNDIEHLYAIGLGKATQRILAVISLDGDEPNILTIFRLE